MVNRMPAHTAKARAPRAVALQPDPEPPPRAEVADGDLLDHVFDRVCSLSGVVTQALLRNPELKRMAEFDPAVLELIVQYVIATIDAERPHVRQQFGGAEGYIAKASAVDRARLERDILTLFNGRNVSEVARRLNIGRTTVYRVLKRERGGA